MSILNSLRALISSVTNEQPRTQSPWDAPTPAVPSVNRRPTPKPPANEVMEATTDKSCVTGGSRVSGIKPGLRCDFLSLSGATLKSLPDDIEVRHHLHIKNCKDLAQVPGNLQAASITFQNCTSLEELPSGWSVAFLDLTGCSGLRRLPGDLLLQGGTLSLKGCVSLRDLPPNLGEVAGLNLSGCKQISHIPSGLKVTSWIDVGDTAIRSLPAGFENVGLRKNGKVVSAHDL